MAALRHWWARLTAGLLLAYGAAAFTLPHGQLLAAFGDLSSLLLIVLATALMISNARATSGQTRIFWLLMAAGCVFWTTNLATWTLFEVVLRKDVPEPFFGDVILFIHTVPFMAAVALRPHRPQEEKKLHFSTLNFLMLLIWWVFLYAFVVFPDEYIHPNEPIYSRNYNVLYFLENVVVLVALGFLTKSAKGGWRKVYWNLFLAMGLYALSSQTLNEAITRGDYYSGSWYDIPFVASICWLIFAALMARELKPACDSAPAQPSRWLAFSPRLAMAAILSLPILGCWSEFASTAPAPIRQFRLLVSLIAMLVLGVCVFWRQYLLDHELIRLLSESQKSVENLKHLQTQLIQKEKLASLGQLVAGAAHEINNPLTAILGYSELLAESRNLDSAQITMTQKIGQQARRTRDLVSGLLRFAQQAPAEKTLVDVRQVVQRALQMKVLQLETKGIRVEEKTSATLPPIWGNFNQLMRCCLEIIGNAMDAMEQTAGGMLSVSVQRSAGEIVLEFADSGPGMIEPKRVFDPFYTTKPIGKGTGLGLSATYGVIQDHRGQITCHNNPHGGAVFVLRFPIAESDNPLNAKVLTASNNR
jgi:signal transduction histidine kinase